MPQQALLPGSFSDRSMMLKPMQSVKGGCPVSLPPGPWGHEYKFIVDGNRILDTGNDHR
jgi:hypothetical protein